MTKEKKESTFQHHAYCLNCVKLLNKFSKLVPCPPCLRHLDGNVAGSDHQDLLGSTLQQEESVASDPMLRSYTGERTCNVQHC